jgi:protein-S-isoprenylcysteine O-methyltransferase Ste14
MTAPLPFTWPYAIVSWPVYAWVFLPEMRLLGRTPRGAHAPREDAGSLRAVILGFGLAVFLAFRLASVVPNAALPGPREVWFVLGLATMIAASLLRRHCFRVLGTFFTGAVTIQKEHRVIDTGAYRFVRHPSYSAALLMVVGIAISCGNWLSVVAAFVCAFAGYAYRARVEERALLAALGEPYARFMATRKRFIPFLY